jgi:hypothetical protein
MKTNFLKLRVYENKNNNQQMLILPKKIFGEVKEVNFSIKKNTIKFK